MNRRDFFTRIAAAAAVPSLLPAAKAEPAAPPIKPPAVPEAGYAWLPYHPHPAPKAARALDSSLFEPASDFQRMADLLRGDHPLRLRFFKHENSYATFEFDVLQSCTYTPPPGIEFNMPRRACIVGDILTLSIRVEVTLPMGRDAAEALTVLNRASNEIYRLAPKVISITPINLP